MTSNKLPKFALCGQLRAGKDEAAKYLYDQYSFKRIAFGDELKHAFHVVYPWIPREPKPRRGYQVFGQACREFDPDVWIKQALYDAERRAVRHPIVITDLRLPAEFLHLKTEGFTVIRILASQEIRIARARAAGDDMTLADLQHDTERHVINMIPDYNIINDGTIDELHTKLDKIVIAALRGLNG